MYNITSNPNAILYDKIAEDINTKLGSMFDDQIPVCWARIEEDQVVPEVYSGSGDKINLRVMPDTTRSLSFFTIEGELTEIDEYYFACPMALTFWVNLQKYDDTKSYDFTTELIRDVTNIIRDYGGYDFAVNVNNPFENFSMLEKEVAANTMRPYTAAKITFTCNAQICGT